MKQVLYSGLGDAQCCIAMNVTIIEHTLSHSTVAKKGISELAN